MSETSDRAITTVMAHQPKGLEEAYRLLADIRKSFGDESAINGAIEHLYKRGWPDPKSYNFERITAKTYEDGLLRITLLTAMIAKALRLRQISEDEFCAVIRCLNHARSHLDKTPFC